MPGFAQSAAGKICQQYFTVMIECILAKYEIRNIIYCSSSEGLMKYVAGLSRLSDYKVDPV